MTMVESTDLVNVSSIAQRLDMPRTNVNAWTRSLAFPPAVDAPGLGGRVYRWSEVQAYVEARPHLKTSS